MKNNIDKKIKAIEKNIQYYSRVYSPECKKVKELKKRLKTIKNST